MGNGSGNGGKLEGKILGLEAYKVLWIIAAAIAYLAGEVVPAIRPAPLEVESDRLIEVLEKINDSQSLIASEQTQILLESQRILEHSNGLLEDAHERGIRFVPMVDRIDRNLEEHRRISEKNHHP